MTALLTRLATVGISIGLALFFVNGVHGLAEALGLA